MRWTYKSAVSLDIRVNVWWNSNNNNCVRTGVRSIRKTSGWKLPSKRLYKLCGKKSCPLTNTYHPLVLLIVECNMGLHIEQRTMNKKHRQRQQQQQLLAWEMRVFVSELRARLCFQLKPARACVGLTSLLSA
ncbi:unnamed protein product [Polarella glacialis]|uniref:Uncharacterized protein n=1 Tax=Polarella glacialis TaxID=89957 RepID=A0A813DRK0_POLGL|nr:unnamed protein product [Polarella glacialis]